MKRKLSRRKAAACLIAAGLVWSSICPVQAEMPVNGGSLRSQAINSYREGRYDEAALLYQKVVAQEPNNLSLLKDLMWVLWKGERFEEARHMADRVLSISPRDQEAKNIIDKAPALELRAKASNYFHEGKYEMANK